MKKTLSNIISLWLLLLLIIATSEARTWRGTSTIITPNVGTPFSSSRSFLRGGGDGEHDSSSVPSVPDSTPRNNVMARGGSTTTTKRQQSSEQQQHQHQQQSWPSSITRHSPTSTAKSNNGTNANSATKGLTSTPVTPLTKKEQKKAAKEAAKELKQHKRIAKKLKVRWMERDLCSCHVMS